MLNVQELERKWLRYKIKSYLPKALLAIILISAIIFIVIYSLSSNTPDKVEIKKTATNLEKKHLKLTSEENITTPTKEIKLKKHSLKRIKEQSQLTLKPSLSFMESLKNIPKEVTSRKPKPKPKPKLQNKIKNLKKPLIEENKETIPDNTIAEETSTNIKEEKVPVAKMLINVKQEEADIQDVIRRFKKNKNPALSLFIAKRFYAIEKYQDAYNYALITNDINSEIEDSWLIAAKSLNHLNKKDQAINLLNEFILKYNSIRAKMILQQIKDGTL